MAYTPDFKLTVNGTAPNQHTTDQLLNMAVNAALTALYDVVSGALGDEAAARIADSAALAGTVSAEATARAQADTKALAAILASGTVPVANVTGTGNAVTAVTPPAYRNVDLDADDAPMISVAWPGANTNGPNEEVTFTLDGVTRNVRVHGGGIPPAGTLSNRRILLSRWNDSMRIMTDVTAADVADGRNWTAPGSRLSPSGLTGIPAGVVTLICRSTTTNRETRWRKGTAPSDGLEIDGLVLDGMGTGQWWRRHVDLLASQIQTALNDAACILTAASGTGDLIELTFTSEMDAAGVSVGNRAIIRYRPAAANQSPNPKCVLRGVTYNIRDIGGADWPANGFVVGREYMLARRSGTTLYVISGDVARSDLLPIWSRIAIALDKALAQSGTDINGYLDWTAVRQLDGGPPEWVVRDVLYPRLLPYLKTTSGSGFAQGDRWVHSVDGAVVPAQASLTQMTIWGSSSTARIATAMTAAFAPHGITVNGQGKDGERSFHTIARQGALPAKLTFPNDTIPASGAVVVTSSNLTPWSYLKPYVGVINGVAGTLSSTNTAITFTRTSAGEAVVSPPDSEFVPPVGLAHRADMQFLWVGKNNLNSGGDVEVQRVISDTDAAFDWLAPVAKRCLVLGHFVDTNTPAVSAERDQIYAVNSAYAKRYGDLYLDVQGYLTGPQVWIDTGISPTSNDDIQQARGSKPQSISSDNGHMNAAGYAAVSNLVVNRMTDLGWI